MGMGLGIWASNMETRIHAGFKKPAENKINFLAAAMTCRCPDKLSRSTCVLSTVYGDGECWFFLGVIFCGEGRRRAGDDDPSILRTLTHHQMPCHPARVRVHKYSGGTTHDIDIYAISM